MPLAMQAKLLRVLEEGEIERVGGDRPMPVDVRVVVATHRNLEELVRQGAIPARTSTIASTSSPFCCRPCASARKTWPLWWTISPAR